MAFIILEQTAQWKYFINNIFEQYFTEKQTGGRPLLLNCNN